MADHNVRTVTEALPGFVEYMAAERRFSPVTIDKYRDNLRWFVRDVGDLALAGIKLEHFVALKARMASRGVKEGRIASVVAAVKTFLVYARDILNVPILDVEKVKSPRPPRRDVVYLLPEELHQFVSAISLESPWTGRPRISAFCFRALVETLAATGMRISEALSLNRGSIDWERREARIVGKGNRERTVFFTPQAIEWIRRYLDVRTDSGDALFATSVGRRLNVSSVEASFRRVWANSRLQKSVTPHVLRHTVATNLLRNGCPIGYIKEVLGHQNLETTCRYYLGVLNNVDTKKAFDAYMRYGAPAPQLDVTVPETPQADMDSSPVPEPPLSPPFNEPQ